MKFQKILSIALLIIVIGQTFLSAEAVSVSNNQQPGVVVDKNVEAIKMNEDLTYLAYLEKYAGEYNATSEIIIKAVDYATQYDSDVRKITEFYGKTNVLEWSSLKGAVEWIFDVPESGLYEMEFLYYALKGTDKPIELCLEINNDVPFSDLTSFTLKRKWQDNSESANVDDLGNEYSPSQAEVFDWQTQYLTSSNGSFDGRLKIYFEKGKNKIKLYSLEEPFILDTITLSPEKIIPTYKQYISKYDKSLYSGKNKIIIQAEDNSVKSDRTLVPSTDMTDPYTIPVSAGTSKINIIGNNWTDNNQWIEWQFEVNKTGLYDIGFRYLQSKMKGFYSYRTLYIDDVVPFKEAELIRYEYDTSWRGMEFSDQNGNPYLIYLEKGTHTLRMQVAQGPTGEILNRLEKTLYSLEEVYRQIIMITGASPDKYRDYNLEDEIPELVSTLKVCRDSLDEEYKAIQEVNNSSSREASILELLSKQITQMLEKKHTIPMKLNNFNSNIGSFASWILDFRKQHLSLDYIVISQKDAAEQKYKSNFFQKLKHEFTLFVYSFSGDYNTMDKSSKNGITIWLNNGRDQSQVISTMIRDMFTPQTGIKVDVKLVNSSMVEAFLSGRTPDVAVLMGKSLPVNLAARGALVNLSEFEDFDEITARFSQDATMPFEYKGGTYAIPDTLTFFMSFYRKDIFNELGIELPETWEEFEECIAVIHQNKMEVGIPYSALDAQTAVDSGMGASNLYSALLMQQGGNFYNDDLSKTALDETIAEKTFEKWTDYYKRYGFDLTYSFYNRFRIGQMPLAIANYTAFSQLKAAAPEIDDLWGMGPIPGTLKEDGTIDRSQSTATTAAVILGTTKNKNASWEFLKWWTGSEAQFRYCTDMQSRLGELGYVGVANLDALSKLWSSKDYDLLNTQLEHLKEIPEVVGGYSTVRGIDNAFRDVLFNNVNPIESLKNWNQQINKELLRKRKEFGLE